MKEYLVFMVIICFVVCACRDKDCHDATYVPSNDLIDNYFGNYKPGNYFIYLNQDSTKKDSIYVGDYTKQADVFNPNNSGKNCVKCDRFEFELHSTFLTNSHLLNILIVPSALCESTSITGYSYDRRNFFLITKNGLDSIEKSQGIRIQKIKNFTLWNNPNNKLTEVTKYEYENEGAIYFAPNIGIAKYITNNGVDTFTITKYYIQ